MASRQFPLIDFQSLKKGDVLSVEYLEKLLGAAYGTTQYQFRSEQLKDQIRRYALLYPRSQKGAIVIMDDETAATYNGNRQVALAEQFVRTVATGAALVDPNQLTESTRRKHESMQRHGAALALEAAKHAARNRLPTGE